MTTLTFDAALPVIFMALMGVSMLVYVISDGYDLGVGMLMHRATAAEKDVLIASIGPFWDANETWLVLGIGILLVAFPKAHGLVLGELYLPVALMLVGLTLRGVAFDFRVKAKDTHKQTWDRLFFAGSTLAAVTQGWMLGRYVSGFGTGWNYPLFAAAIAVALPMAYVLMGATWLVMKTEGELQERAVQWARTAWTPMVAGMVLISMATPWISSTVRSRWFALPEIIALMAIPLMTAVALLAVRGLLRHPAVRGPACWLPFLLLILVFVLGFLGLAYSIYPYVVIDQLTIWQAARSPAALKSSSSEPASRCRRSSATPSFRTAYSGARRASCAMPSPLPGMLRKSSPDSSRVGVCAEPGIRNSITDNACANGLPCSRPPLRVAVSLQINDLQRNP